MFRIQALVVSCPFWFLVRRDTHFLDTFPGPVLGAGTPCRGISRHPSAFTPVADQAGTFTSGRPSRTFGSARDPCRTVRPAVKRAGPEGLNQLVQLPAHQRRTCDWTRPGDPERGSQFSTRTGRGSQQVTTVDTTEASPRSAAPVLQEAREVRPAQLVARQPARPRCTAPAAVPVAGVDPVGLTSPYPALHATRRSASIISWANHENHRGSKEVRGRRLPGSPRTAAPEPAQCHPRAFRSPSCIRTTSKDSRGGRLDHPRRHAVLRQTSHLSTCYPIHHFPWT